MMIIADPNTLLGEVCREVARLKPGESIAFGYKLLRDIPSFHHNGACFSPADRVLENIVGSSYTHSYAVDEDGRSVTFHRHKEPGHYYQSPDRRTEGRASWAPVDPSVSLYFGPDELIVPHDETAEES